MQFIFCFHLTWQSFQLLRPGALQVWTEMGELFDRIGWEMKRGKAPISPPLLPFLRKPVRRPPSDSYRRPQKSCLGPQFLTDRRVMMICGVGGSVSKAVKEKLSLMMKRLLGPTSTTTTSPPPHSTEMAVYNHLTLQNSFSFTLSWLWFAFNLLRSQQISLEIHK